MGSIMKPSWSPMIVSTNSKLVDIFSASRMMIDWGLRLWGIFIKTSNFLSESREAVQYIATLEFLWAICTTLYKEMPFACTATQEFLNPDTLFYHRQLNRPYVQIRHIAMTFLYKPLRYTMLSFSTWARGHSIDASKINKEACFQWMNYLDRSKLSC